MKQVFSSREFWKGFTVEQNMFPPVGNATLPENKHTLLFNWGEPLTIEMKVGDQWKESLCDKGAVVCLSSVGNATTIRWNQSFHAMAIFIDPEFVNQIVEIKDFQFVPQFNNNDSFLLDVVTKFSTVGGGDVFAEKVYVESLAVACIVYLAKKYRGSKEIYFPKGRLNPYQLKEVIDFAYSYMQFNIGLHELAGLVHLSPYHFGRLFKQTVGRSPYQFILALKIECAMKLIKQNNGPISEIAYQLNFSDQSHFSNAFRKATGISPRQYLYS
ncbi:MAG TPA: helix-turn-helix transcriptional regulator [Cyclobacteriaceae bacterium]|nr:helix-turn-helix transcriptional regulator [Cyclobacteriaceae bacterium]